MGKMIKCESCGAEYDEAKVRCPYCGTAYLPAEENEYMEQLDGVRRELLDYRDSSEKGINKRLFSLIRGAILIVLVAALLIMAKLFLTALSEKSGSRQKKDEFLKDQGIVTEFREEEER